MITSDRSAAEPIRQLGTHRKLVSRTGPRKIDARLPLDAIVVPASRPATNLETAITLARATHSVLVVLCSHQVTPTKVHQVLAERSFDRAVVINLPDNYSHELLEFRALASIRGELPAACSYFATNLSTKRNLGLLLGHMVGWERIFFLDDDIRDIGHPDLQSMVSMLARYRTAGMRATEFPDNSAACHAHRHTGGAQDVFLSGAALAVDIQQQVGFFPDIYNEDWLFFYDDAASGQLGCSERKTTQLRYDPFRDPRRAAWQEFGDVLAEGLYALLDRGLGVEHATHEYWVDFLRARHSFLRAILRRSGTAKWEIRDELVLAVKAALECSTTIGPRVLERYIQLWRRDLGAWQRRVATIGEMYPLDVALKTLGLESSGYGWAAAEVARPQREAATEEPPTKPYELSDLFDLLRPSPVTGGKTGSDLEERRGGTGRVGLNPDHGPAGMGQRWLGGSAWRPFRRPERGYASQEPSPAPEAAAG
jgi:hypothetical protein